MQSRNAGQGSWARSLRGKCDQGGNGAKGYFGFLFYHSTVFSEKVSFGFVHRQGALWCSVLMQICITFHTSNSKRSKKFNEFKSEISLAFFALSLSLCSNDDDHGSLSVSALRRSVARVK